MTPQNSRPGETKVSAFSFWPQDEQNIQEIMRITENWNRSEAVRAALANYLEYLREEPPDA